MRRAHRRDERVILRSRHGHRAGQHLEIKHVHDGLFRRVVEGDAIGVIEVLVRRAVLPVFGKHRSDAPQVAAAGVGTVPDQVLAVLHVEIVVPRIAVHVEADGGIAVRRSLEGVTAGDGRASHCHEVMLAVAARAEDHRLGIAFQVDRIGGHTEQPARLALLADKRIDRRQVGRAARRSKDLGDGVGNARFAQRELLVDQLHALHAQ